MGARLHHAWLVHPLLNLEEIVSRHEAVEELAENYTMRERLQREPEGHIRP
jgi:DNA mismatch repair ATPase MutS